MIFNNNLTNTTMVAISPHCYMYAVISKVFSTINLLDREYMSYFIIMDYYYILISYITILY